MQERINWNTQLLIFLNKIFSRILLDKKIMKLEQFTKKWQSFHNLVDQAQNYFEINNEGSWWCLMFDVGYAMWCDVHICFVMCIVT